MTRSPLPALAIFALAVNAWCQEPRPPAYPPIQIAPPATRFQPSAPLPTLANVVLDTFGDAIGVAQQTARAQGLQGRLLWVDATANISRTNSDEKIADLMAKAKAVGFNTVVYDIKPIVGHTMYPSRYAPKLAEWKGAVMPKEYDPLAAMVRESKRQGLQLFVSLNAFSEGHRDFQMGLGYEHPEWQTVLYEPKPFVRASFLTRPTFAVVSEPNAAPPDGSVLGLVTSALRLPAKPEPDAVAIVVDAGGRVLAQGGAAELRSVAPSTPSGGSVLWGWGDAGAYLRTYAQPGDVLEFDSTAQYVPIAERPAQQIPLMVNPHASAVQDRAIAILREVVQGYDVDGVLYDDRLRLGGMNADFSEETRAQFEAYVGRPLQWPDEAFRFVLHPDLSRGIAPGPYYEAWLTFRAMTIRNFVARARSEVVAARPAAKFGVYAGSWFGEYPAFGSNWSSNEFDAGFWFLSDAYRKTGFAPLLDVLVTGCYYKTATIAQAMGAGSALGMTVEAAGQLSNRAAKDQAWTYAGIMLMDFKDDPERLCDALQAACGSTQGVMVFDLSHDIDTFWPILERAFRQPAKAPHAVDGLLAAVRKKRAALEAAGVKDPAVPILAGAAGAGF
ncbi:MAG: family 10 glycosylhydrolase [Fimbriimonadaceae bacterium]|nr:family 10 glycosylhydrolase [Fimbriimonadaceae bacterium]